MWFSADILGLFSFNVGPFSPNVVLRHPLFSFNLVPEPRMFSGRGVYILGPLHVGEPELVIAPTEDRLFALWFHTQWTNACALWNTRYMDLAQNHLRSKGSEVLGDRNLAYVLVRNADLGIRFE